MNHTIIHDRAGLNQFYAKVYAFVGLGIGLSALVSGLMLTVFQSQLVYFLMQGRPVSYTHLTLPTKRIV